MKKVKVKGGWDEVERKKIRFERFAKRKFARVKSFLKGPKKTCDFCKDPWTLMEEDDWIGIVATNKNNKVVCMDCWDHLELDKYEASLEVIAKLTQEQQDPS